MPLPLLSKGYTVAGRRLVLSFIRGRPRSGFRLRTQTSAEALKLRDPLRPPLQVPVKVFVEPLRLKV